MLTILKNTVARVENNSWEIYIVSKVELLNLDESKQAILSSLKFTAKFAQVAVLPESKKIYVGLTLESKQKTFDPFHRVNMYVLGAKLYRKIASLDINTIYLHSNPIFTEPKKNVFGDFSKNLFEFVLGLSQANWNLDTYLPPASAKNKAIELSLDTNLSELVTEEFQTKLKALNDGIILTRSLVDDIPEYINPTTLPGIVKRELSGKPTISIDVLDYSKLQELGMEGITFVGRASRHDPVMVHVVLKPAGIVTKKVCLVGKGVTYDSGGLDIKTGGSMKTMKVDMAGSATMFGVMKTLSEIGLQNTEVHWISAWVENMVDGSSYKTDDILTTYSGQTVEILNTDAEGRLTLADALTYATLQDPDFIVDTATLTGAAVVSVSPYYTAMMGNDAELIRALDSAFVEEGERTVHTPMPEVLRSKVKGRVAELINTSKLPKAGHITAGLFLSHFVDQNNFRNSKLGITEPKAYAWAHLDIAGSCWNDKMNDIDADGATGQSVKGLSAWILGLES